MKCIATFLTFCSVSIFVPFVSADESHSQSISYDADYVIVGVGTAGATMAKMLTDDGITSVIALHNGENLTNNSLIRLSKNAKFTVLSSLIASPNIPTDIKAQLGNILGIPVSFLYQNGLTLPQIDNQEILWEISLPEGGASSTNAGAWCRGTNKVYSQWEALAGPEWSVDRITGIYKELERYHGETDNSDARGYYGPISVRQTLPSLTSLKFTWAIIRATNFPLVLDYNDPLTPLGASAQMQLTQSGREGKYRVSSATAFLNKHVMTFDGAGVGDRQLRVLFNSTALRTIWEGNKAIGVEYFQNGENKKVFAKKGVIVCAGLFSSPFLLHSGVGPKDLLEPLGIPIIFENPNVGQNLTDQPGVPLIFSTNPKDFPAVNNSLFSQIAWLPIPGDNSQERAVRFSTGHLVPGFALAVFDLCQPKSRGSITINSLDPLANPVIDLGALNDPIDLATLQAGLSIYIKNIHSELQSIDPAYQLLFPDPAILDDPLLVENFIRQNLNSNHCFQSHCRMAPYDQGGVVDSSGHVYGVDNLIVADDSIVPICMDGSPMASAYLIAANIAQQLLTSQQK